MLKLDDATRERAQSLLERRKREDELVLDINLAAPIFTIGLHGVSPPLCREAR